MAVRSIGILGAVACWFVTGAVIAVEPGTDAVDRSPMSLAVSPDRRCVLTANHTADSVSLIELATGRVIAETSCGRGPVDVVWTDAQHALVSLLHEDSIVLLSIDGEAVSVEAAIPVGDEPREIAINQRRDVDATATRAFVALAGLDQVAVVDLTKREVIERLSVGGVPKTVAVSPDGRWLVTCCSVPGEVFVHDAESLELQGRRKVYDDGFNLGVPLILPDSSAVIVPSVVNRPFRVTPGNIERGWVIDNRLTKMLLPHSEPWEQKQLALDKRSAAVGDAHAVALSPSGDWFAVTCGGTHELLIIDAHDLPWRSGDPGDFLPAALRDDPARFRRIRLEGRPLGVEYLDEQTVLVANYLLNAVQVVDLSQDKIVRTVELGGPGEVSLARRGEAIFYDADRSLNSWFSCHTCHPDGHTSGQTFDTLNDLGFGAPKLTPSLRGVTNTPPWTWHGWQTDLGAAMRKSLKDTMSTRQPISDEDVAALLEYLAGCTVPDSPHRTSDEKLTAAIGRGRQLFAGKAGCVTCHAGEQFTSDQTFTVGLESPRDKLKEFNPPSLRGVSARRRFLHDGRAKSLEEVLTRWHRPEKLAGESLTDAERADLIAYLKSL